MNRVSSHRRLARVVFAAAAAFALLTGAIACDVVDRPIRVDHAGADP